MGALRVQSSRRPDNAAVSNATAIDSRDRARNHGDWTARSLMPRTIQKFEVSLKAFVARGNEALFVREADTGYWELPGGRIDAGEETAPHELILAREIEEELGSQIRIAVGTDTVTWTRRRPLDGAFLFIVARVCHWRSGEIRLSHEHDDHAWVAGDAWMNLHLPPESGYSAGIAELCKRHRASLPKPPSDW